MKLIIWLWNPWDKYLKTRHNAGFLVLDDWCDRNWGTEFLYQSKFDGAMATGMIWKWQYIALKPMTFMNKSWESVSKVMNFYKIQPEDCIILHDDLDIKKSVIKMKFNWSHWWHNWIRDIYAKTWLQRFWKLKLWIWRPEHSNHETIDYVLWKFSDEDIHELLTQEKEIDARIEQAMKNNW